MCGRNISKETSSTIGQQRRFNYALAPMSKEKFVRVMTTDLQQAPAYFSRDAEINRTGAAALGAVERPAMLSSHDVQDLQAQGFLILDVRTATDFGSGFISGAMNIGLGGQFASWAGTLIPFGTPIVLIADDEAKIDEAVTRLARVGIESVKGYLDGGMNSWRADGLPESQVRQITVDNLRRMLVERADLQVIDVRRPGEYADGHVPGAMSLPLGPDLSERAAGLNLRRPTAVICAGGYRSSAATSLLAPRGFTELVNVTGGTGAWVSSGFPVE
jgi:rhodanese-related sulfurtransferase